MEEYKHMQTDSVLVLLGGGVESAVEIQMKNSTRLRLSSPLGHTRYCIRGHKTNRNKTEKKMLQT